VPRANSDGRALAYEFMIATPAIRNLIRENKAYMIPCSIQTGGQLGMVTMDAYLAELHLKKVNSFETGLARSVDGKEFERLVTSGGLAAEEDAGNSRPVMQRASAGDIGGRAGPPAIGRGGRGN